MKTFFKEFKTFIQQGNVMDLAVGVIIGAAFKAIVDSLVKDIISPLLGIVLQDNFAALTLTIGKAKLGYGAFIMAIVNFVIMAFILFTIIKVMNSFKKQPEAVEEAPTTKVCPHCMSEINIEAHRCPHCTSELAD